MSAPSRFRDLEKALAALPENVVGEIVFGRLVTQPRPAMRHSVATTNLLGRLTPPFRDGVGGPGGWTFAFEPELALGPHVLVPDIAAWRVETAPVEALDVARVAIAPDWICETLSTSTEAFDREEKALIYGANGIGHLWFLDPMRKSVEAMRNDRGRWRVVGTFQFDDAAASIEPFESVPIDLATIWLR